MSASVGVPVHTYACLCFPSLLLVSGHMVTGDLILFLPCHLSPFSLNQLENKAALPVLKDNTINIISLFTQNCKSSHGRSLHARVHCLYLLVYTLASVLHTYISFFFLFGFLSQGYTEKSCLEKQNKTKTTTTKALVAFAEDLSSVPSIKMMT